MGGDELSACYYRTIVSLGRGRTDCITGWSYTIHPVNSHSPSTVAHCVLENMCTRSLKCYKTILIVQNVESLSISSSQCLCCWQSECSLRPQTLCGAPALPKIWTCALWLLEKTGDSGEKSKAVQYSCDGNNPSQLSSFCQRRQEGRRRKKEIWEEEEKRKDV